MKCLYPARIRRKEHDAVDEAKATDEVVEFWQQMMTRYGDEEKYNEYIINQFKHGDDPEIIIVVSKLLTGFDAPRNTVLYLTRPMKEHNLLQAIARVNRVLDSDSDDYNTDKDEGYIVDYEGVLENLDEAFSHYDALAGYEEKDLEGLMRNVGEILDKLPQAHSHLWALFQSLDGNADEEAYEVFLADDAIREDFYGRLTVYGKALAAARLGLRGSMMKRLKLTFTDTRETRSVSLTSEVLLNVAMPKK